jgi:Response regulator containing a CheY-like receiver domain and an HTH DNA-binding domain
MKIYKVIVVDDHPIFVKGLVALLNEIENIKVIASAKNGKKFLELLSELEPDIVFIDIKMPIMNGIEATEKALELQPDLKILALTMFDEYRYVQIIMNAGAKGFLNKDVTKLELQKAIEKVTAGEEYFSDNVITTLMQKDGKSDSLSLTCNFENEKLSVRELEVLQLLSDGLSTSEIAQRLFISQRTVEHHRSNLLAKTQSKNVVGLIKYAIANGLVEI